MAKDLKRPRIYIAGPYSKGSVADNVATAMAQWHVLWRIGFNPYCPHLSHFLQMADPFGTGPRTLDQWLEVDFPWLDCCEAVFLLSGESCGADMECARARAQGKPIFIEDEKACQWLMEWRERQKALEMNEAEIRRKEVKIEEKICREFSTDA